MRIENVFSESTDVNSDKIRLLTEDEMHVMMHAFDAEKKDKLIERGTKFEASLKESFLYYGFSTAIMAKRLAVMTPDVDYSVALVGCLSYSCNSPAEAVMFAWSLADATHAVGKTVDMMVFTEKVCPFGYPNRDYLAQIWDAQKVTGGNGIDDPHNWKWASKVKEVS